MVSVRFEGARNLERAFAELGAAAGERLARRALKKAAEPVRDKAKRLAPKDERLLEQSIAISTRVSRGSGLAIAKRQAGIVRVFVGIDQSKPQLVNVYSIVQEYGNADNAAQPYFRPAWDSEAPKAVDTLAPIIWDDVERTAKRAARKAAKAAKASK